MTLTMQPGTFYGVRLTKREYELAMLLAGADGLPMPRTVLIRTMFGDRGTWDEQNINGLAHRLRQKLAGTVEIESIRGFGYRMIVPSLRPCERCGGKGVVAR